MGIGLGLCPFPCDVFTMYRPRTLPLAPSVNMNHRNAGSTAKVVRHHNPHPVVRVQLVTKDRIPVDEGTLVEFPIDCE